MKPLQRQSEANQIAPSDSRVSTPEAHLDTITIADKGFPLPTTKEWGEGKGEGQPKERPGCGNEPFSPTLSPLVPRGERGYASLLMAAVQRAAPTPAVDILILSDGTILVHNLTPDMAATLNAVNPQDPTIAPRVVARTS